VAQIWPPETMKHVAIYTYFTVEVTSNVFSWPRKIRVTAVDSIKKMRAHIMSHCDWLTKLSFEQQRIAENFSLYLSSGSFSCFFFFFFILIFLCLLFFFFFVD